MAEIKYRHGSHGDGFDPCLKPDSLSEKVYSFLVRTGDSVVI